MSVVSSCNVKLTSHLSFRIPPVVSHPPCRFASALARTSTRGPLPQWCPHALRHPRARPPPHPFAGSAIGNIAARHPNRPQVASLTHARDRRAAVYHRPLIKSRWSSAACHRRPVKSGWSSAETDCQRKGNGCWTNPKPITLSRSTLGWAQTPNTSTRIG